MEQVAAESAGAGEAPCPRVARYSRYVHVTRFSLGYLLETDNPPPQDPLGKRLDYIFAGAGDIHALGGGWVVKRANVGMMMRHPVLGCSLSDHFAVEATLTFHPYHQPPAPDSDSADPNRRESSITATATLQTATHQHQSSPPPPEDSITAASPTTEKSRTDSAVHNGAYLQLQSPAPSSTNILDTTYQTQLDSFLEPPSADDVLSAEAYDAVLALVRSYTAREEAQLTWRAGHFFAALAVTVACLVGVWFTPSGKNYVSFILVLVSSLSLTAGTVDGLMALLFFRSELKAVREFEWEVRNARAISFGGGVEEVEFQDGPGGKRIQ